jgi:hypothetical protein
VVVGSALDVFGESLVVGESVVDEPESELLVGGSEMDVGSDDEWDDEWDDDGSDDDEGEVGSAL